MDFDPVAFACDSFGVGEVTLDLHFPLPMLFYVGIFVATSFHGMA